ncbi:glutamyl-tRNA reductase [Selenomonas ruminantium]|uniref:Glutamyl-tRNA reductase n=1 Tax=Selenomonas ruminantium TaxID=971 RepID=A0A1M6V1Q1_SELRU|nr:glutamyl-tRNA reductase [Selenomonas ruminantium]SHK75383.1 glutamyl-tRNA reductase [Selenomonas ruminantium]
MELLMLGLNHKTAPVDVRERFSIPKAAVKSGLANLGKYEGILEAVVLSTCNRSEMYAVVENPERDLATLKQFLFDLTGNEEDIDEYLYHYADEACVQHLFQVASSLDSLVLGEGQILSQVKEAYAMSREAGTTSTVLNTLFHRAIATGKRVRTETRIQFNSVSVSYAAVELAREALGELHEASALIFGAGKMAELTAQHLISHGVKKIYVTNRHIERAELLAAQFGGEAVLFEEAMKRAVDVDVIVTSTGAPHYVIKPWETRQLMSKRKGRQLFLIDIAVPRDVDPEVGEIKGVTLYNIDALEEVVDEHIEERRHEARQAEKIVQEEVDSIMERFQYLSFRPLMARLSDRCERIRAREVKRASSKLPDLNEEQWRQVEHMSRMIVRKILRMPMMKLNSAAGTENEQFYIEAMRALFKLDTIGETANSEEHDCYRYAQQ